MRTKLVTSLAVSAAFIALGVSANGRTIKDLRGLEIEPLRTSVAPKFFQRLLSSEVESWVAARGILRNGHLSGVKIIHSELNGLYDPVMQDLAKHWEIIGSNPELGTYLPYTIVIHLLIYRLKDGKLAVSFLHVSNPGGNQIEYRGPAWIAMEKNGKWKEIKPPQS